MFVTELQLKNSNRQTKFIFDCQRQLW